VYKANRQEKVAAPARVREESYDNMSSRFDEEETPDDITVASASYMGEDDGYPMSQQSTGHRKRKADQISAPNHIEQTHIAYSDELLDYFMLSQADEPAQRPEPPPNFQPDWVIDSDGHTAMHWACAMGDTEVMKQLKRFGASLTCENIRGETPLMRAVLFTNCSDKQSMPLVVKELIDTVHCVDYCQATAIHHAAALTASRSKHQVARYYLDVILNKMQETWDQEEVQRLLDAQDINGNTACHIAAKWKARKCVRALIGRGASTDISNNEGVLAEDLIQQLNSRPRDHYPNASSSPFAPDSHRQIPMQGPIQTNLSRHTTSHHSEAAMSVELKVTPLILDKFQGLAQAFDEELIDRDNSEKEAKRILNSTHIELATMREQILELGAAEDPDHVDEEQQAQLIQAERAIMSVVEQQQQIRLNALVQSEGMPNGSSPFENGDDKSEEKIHVVARFIAEQRKRVDLVNEYTEATSLAGMGEKGEMYRKLIVRCLGIKEDEVDENLDSLISVLEEDKVETNGAEVLLVDEL
jgi:transcription factor MBP1